MDKQWPRQEIIKIEPDMEVPREALVEWFIERYTEGDITYAELCKKLAELGFKKPKQ